MFFDFHECFELYDDCFAGQTRMNMCRLVSRRKSQFVLRLIARCIAIIGWAKSHGRYHRVSRCFVRSSERYESIWSDFKPFCSRYSNINTRLSLLIFGNIESKLLIRRNFLSRCNVFFPKLQSFFCLYINAPFKFIRSLRRKWKSSRSSLSFLILSNRLSFFLETNYSNNFAFNKRGNGDAKKKR